MLLCLSLLSSTRGHSLSRRDERWVSLTTCWVASSPRGHSSKRDCFKSSKSGQKGSKKGGQINLKKVAKKWPKRVQKRGPNKSQKGRKKVAGKKGLKSSKKVMKSFVKKRAKKSPRNFPPKKGPKRVQNGTKLNETGAPTRLKSTSKSPKPKIHHHRFVNPPRLSRRESKKVNFSRV
jgi:hypothetical protein